MDIKIKGTARAGILVYDTDDMYAREEMNKAQKVTNISIALDDIMTGLRAIRKYDAVPTVFSVPFDDKLKQVIMQSQEYYSAFIIQCLKDNDCLEFLD